METIEQSVFRACLAGGYVLSCPSSRDGARDEYRVALFDAEETELKCVTVNYELFVRVRSAADRAAHELRLSKARQYMAARKRRRNGKEALHVEQTQFRPVAALR